MIPFAKNVYHLTAGNLYIYDKDIVLSRVDAPVDYITSCIKENIRFYENGNYINAYDHFFTIYQPYVFGKDYAGITTRYVSDSDTYDSKTHTYLGQYLRTYKAVYDINLMPFYNLFSNEYAINLDIKHDYQIKQAPFHRLINKTNTNYKYFSIPINFCQEYTIALDSLTPVSLTPIFIGKKGCLEEPTNLLWKMLNVLNSEDFGIHKADHDILVSRNNYYKDETSFSKPFVFQSPCIVGARESENAASSEIDQSTLLAYEKYLRLIIKVPISNSSSLVVLEGNYSNTSHFADKIISTSEKDISQYQSYQERYSNFNEYLNEKLISNLSLLRINDTNNYAFCGRLFEYLVNNVISNAEQFESNIMKVQKYLNQTQSGIWQPRLRTYTYKAVNNYADVRNLQTVWDANGFIDKDSEKLLASYYRECERLAEQANKTKDPAIIDQLNKLLKYKE